jgi:Protein of unknown function (DUF1761)
MNTEVFSQINWLAVLVAALAYFMLGAIWYSKALFGSKWAVLVGLDMSNPDKKKGMGKMMAGTFILIIVTCIALALFVHRLDLIVISSALKLGFITGVCFATTAVAISFIYESRPTALYFIDCGYHLAGHLIVAIVLVLWQ